MKIPVFFLLIILSYLNSNAQNSISKMEIKQNGFIGMSIDSTKSYIVLDFPNKKKNDLYKSSLIYLNKIYKEPQKVLSLVENESISINGFTESIKGDLYWYKYPMNYNINIQFKDGKIRFEPRINELSEIWFENKARKIYIANTDSEKQVEIDCIWMKNKDNENYFLYKDKLKLNIDNWINSYISNFVDGLEKNEW